MVCRNFKAGADFTLNRLLVSFLALPNSDHSFFFRRNAREIGSHRYRFGGSSSPSCIAPSIAGAQTPKKEPYGDQPAADGAGLGRHRQAAGLGAASGFRRSRIRTPQMKTKPPPWNEAAAKKIAAHVRRGKGRPADADLRQLPARSAPLLECWSPTTRWRSCSRRRRVTMLGESDGNRLRRIYTDGRGHPEESDPTFHGHSIGHWEGDTLVVDTTDIVPQAPLADQRSRRPSPTTATCTCRAHSSRRQGHPARQPEIIAPNMLTKPGRQHAYSSASGRASSTSSKASAPPGTWSSASMPRATTSSCR